MIGPFGPTSGPAGAIQPNPRQWSEAPGEVRTGSGIRAGIRSPSGKPESGGPSVGTRLAPGAGEACEPQLGVAGAFQAKPRASAAVKPLLRGSDEGPSPAWREDPQVGGERHRTAATVLVGFRSRDPPPPPRQTGLAMGRGALSGENGEGGRGLQVCSLGRQRGIKGMGIGPYGCPVRVKCSGTAALPPYSSLEPPTPLKKNKTARGETNRKDQRCAPPHTLLRIGRV